MSGIFEILKKRATSILLNEKSNEYKIAYLDAILEVFVDVKKEMGIETEPMQSHASDSRCICTDGKAAQRDVSEPCQS